MPGSMRILVVDDDRDNADGLAELNVITGVYMVKQSKEIFFADVTEVSFHKLTETQISYYVNKYKPYDKAGAYAIQEWIGAVGIKSINGDFYNVMGLPISRVVAALEEFGYN